MDNLINQIKSIQKTGIKDKIDCRLKDFNNINKNSSEELFKEMCFCILTANYNAEKSIIIQDSINDDFFKLTEEELANRLVYHGHRFPNTRAKYIHESVKYIDIIKNVVNSSDGERLREWFVKNIKGLGYKEASHFLRNIGFADYAIVDFHIVDILVRAKIIDKPKTISKSTYLEIENKLKKIANKLDMSLSELDLYLWYIETGKILK